MPKTQPTIDCDSSRPWISPRDQASLFVLAMSALAMMLCFWWYQGGRQGGLVEIDRASPLEAQFQVDINQAEWPELLQLPGLGETLARRVVDDRLVHGEFLALEDLQRVHGIGVKTLEKIRPYLRPIPRDTDWAAIEERGVRTQN